MGGTERTSSLCIKMRLFSVYSFLSMHSFITMSLLLKFNNFIVFKLLKFSIKEKNKHFMYALL